MAWRLNGDLSQSILVNLSSSGSTASMLDKVKYLWDKLPAGVPIMGNFSGAGTFSFFGYIYPNRNYGGIIVFGFTGQLNLIYVNNGVFYDKNFMSEQSS